ncbi:hypothetical protein HAX54_002077 [Datura stramonium]|uniref:Uncharacterized protein n=1 Tax=Datura stramonium TaxID=4076 RepID=A0ABS8WTP3_DATST|nr:hypothetical protein [Datura stramonium]
MAPPLLRRYEVRWVTEKEDIILTLGLGFVFDAPGDCSLNMSKGRKRLKLRIGVLLTRFLYGHYIEEEEVDYRPSYDPRGINVTKTKEPEGINSSILFVNERNARTDNMLSHLYGMQMLQLRMHGVTEEKLQQHNIDYPLSEHSRALCRFGPGYEEPLDDDMATED